MIRTGKIRPSSSPGICQYTKIPRKKLTKYAFYSAVYYILVLILAMADLLESGSLFPCAGASTDYASRGVLRLSWEPLRCRPARHAHTTPTRGRTVARTHRRVVGPGSTITLWLAARSVTMILQLTSGIARLEEELHHQVRGLVLSLIEKTKYFIIKQQQKKQMNE